MLRVITKQWGDTYRLELHGILGGDWVPLLEQQWRAIAHDVPSARVTIVLSDVDFIDSDGERLLRSMAVAGVEFVVSGCMNRSDREVAADSRTNHEWEV
jgi:anti-anti-sigma regulatory factor